MTGSPRVDPLPAVHMCPSMEATGRASLNRWWHASPGINWMIGSREALPGSGPGNDAIGWPRRHEVHQPAGVYMYLDWAGNGRLARGYRYRSYRPDLVKGTLAHRGGTRTNAVYVDGHAETVDPAEGNLNAPRTGDPDKQERPWNPWQEN